MGAVTGCRYKAACAAPSSDGTGGEDGGTLVTLRIRAMKKKELEEYVQTINRG